MWPGMILKSGNKTTNPSLLSYIYSLFFYLLIILKLNPSCSSARMFLTISAFFFLVRTNLNSLFLVFVSLPMTVHRWMRSNMSLYLMNKNRDQILSKRSLNLM
ncbi:unnamed protein product [Musa acuminata var. zebrina]